MRHRNTTGNETKELRQHRLTHTWDIHTKIQTHTSARTHIEPCKKRETTTAATAKWRESKRVEMNQNRIEILSTDNGCVINFSLLLFVVLSDMELLIHISIWTCLWHFVCVCLTHSLCLDSSPFQIEVVAFVVIMSYAWLKVNERTDVYRVCFCFPF